MTVELSGNYLNEEKEKVWQGLPWQPSGQNSTLPMQGTWIQSPVRELDPTCCNWELLHMPITKDPTY